MSNTKVGKSHNLRHVLPIVLMIIVQFSFNGRLNSQRQVQHFKIGLSAGLSFCQVEGDRLTGYHDKGFEIGLVGSYRLNEKAFLFVSPSFGKYGSVRRREELPVYSKKAQLVMNMQDINILWAYMIHFGDNKVKNGLLYKAHFGMKIHRLLTVDNSVMRNHVKLTNEAVDFEDLKHIFPSVNIGFGIYVTKSMSLELRYDHALMNLLDETNVLFDKLTPYQFSINAVYAF